MIPMPLDLAAIQRLYRTGADALYGGEAITQQQHACQCAALAQAVGAPLALVAAAVLHDLGHLVHGLGEDCAERGIDDRHEVSGAALLARWFPPAVSEPVRLHVEAKRWLCHAEPGYHASLSPASRRSLALQGGTFTAAEADAWIMQPHAPAAVHLRRWDDLAKDPHAVVPGVDAWWPLIAAQALAARSGMPAALRETEPVLDPHS